MHGFFGSYGKAVNWDLSELQDKSLVERTHEDKSFHLKQLTLPKFLSSKYFADTDDCFLAVEGVLFEAESPEKCIANYRSGQLTFWDSWRGSFCGVLYDKREDRLILFNDHIGSKMLFYKQTTDGLVFASDLFILAHSTGTLQSDKTFIRDMLSDGFTLSEHTFIEGIHKLTAGKYLCYSKSQQLTVSDYHRFSNTPFLYDDAAMVHETDKLFRQAVERVIRKNEEEGLQHFFPLSGGLDSRMAQFVAHQFATQPITNFTYSQSGHYDHLLPKEISSYLGNTWQFMPLDGGSYLTDIDRVVRLTEGLVNYMGPIEIVAFATRQDWQHKGVVLTGVNGDNILATETDSKHEMDRIYGLGFNGNSLGSPLVLQHYTESYSPYTDVDLLDYVLHIPTDKRRNYAFYDRWIQTCYPQAAQWHHKYEQIGHRHKMVTIAGRNIRMREVPVRLLMTTLKRLHIYNAYKLKKGESMNPYDDWLNEKPDILREINNYYSTHRHLLNGIAPLSTCDEIMRMSTMLEKGKVLTILSNIKAFADNG